MIKFREKTYSFQDLIGNLHAGALAAGTISSLIINNKDIVKDPLLKKILLGTSIGVTVISGLGLLMDYYNRRKSIHEVKNSVNHNINFIADLLKADGKIEGKDFFLDPREADSSRAKVSMILRKDIGTMDFIVNTSRDPKLDSLTKSIFRDIAGKPGYFKKETDNNTEIIVTSLDTSFDPSYVVGVAEKFINKKVPVYLLEINR